MTTALSLFQRGVLRLRGPAGWPLLAVNLGLALLYFATAKFGFQLAFATKQVTAVWPPTGLAAVAYLLLGRRAWPGIFAGAWAINAVSNEPIVTAVGIAVGNSLAGLAGVALLRRWVPAFDPALRHPRSVLGWVLLVGAGGCLVSASNGVLQLALGGIVPWAVVPSVAWVWWVGDTMGVLLFGSLLLTWLTPVPQGRSAAAGPAEQGMLFASLTVVCLGVFLHAPTADPGGLRLEYAVFPFVIWVGLRDSQRACSAAVLLICGVALWGAIHDRGPFGLGPLDARLVLLELFMAVTAITGLTLGATAADRRRADAELQDAHDELERRVVARTAELAAANRDKDALLKEVYHRVKNNLQVVQSLLSLKLRRVVDPTAQRVLNDAAQRMHAMALVHEMLYGSDDISAVPAPTLVRRLYERLARGEDCGPRVTAVFAVDDVLVGLEQAVPLGLLLSELIANVLRHAFPDGRQGTLWLSLSSMGSGQAELRVEDNGVGLPPGFALKANASGGLGMAAVLAQQLGGELQVRALAGACFVLCWPAGLDAMAQRGTEQ
jgi:two-component sensor histidine kinase/integral membrane sensor domain MASE1